MHIKLTEEIPVYQRKRRMSPGDLEICTDKCKELLEAGLIRPSESEYAVAIVVAARKDLTRGILSRQMCGDYRDLNKLTVADRYPMPTPEDIFDKVQGVCVFSTLDLRQGFNQIRIAEGDVRKTAFHGPDELYKWLFMPFGLKNASAVFQRAMDCVLQGLQHCSACYIDDVVVFSLSGEQHVEDVGQVLAAIGSAGLTCHPKKCHFGSLTMQYLGFEVCGGRMSIQEAKVVIVTIGLNVPKTKDGVHRRISAQRLQTLIAFWSQLQTTCYKLDLERLHVAYTRQVHSHDLIKD
ncbi:unnamed protein product [Closterium sp. NIES-54]